MMSSKYNSQSVLKVAPQPKVSQGRKEYRTVLLKKELLLIKQSYLASVTHKWVFMACVMSISIASMSVTLTLDYPARAN